MKTTLTLVLLAFATLRANAAESIVTSKHNLSASGIGELRAVTETEICMFCHTPHRATGTQPLWNRALSSATYTPYASSTLKATVGQPTGASKLCLSCHDGTVALGMLNSRVGGIEMKAGVTTLPPGRANLGTDLADDHPVSFTYDSALTTANGQLRDPSTLNQKVRLDHNNQMQCTSCHDPHNNEFGQFLVKANTQSALCTECHSMTSWQNSAHRISSKTWNGSGPNPFPNITANSVSSAACESCHAPHNAGIKERLLTQTTEELTCNVCHNGNVAEKNVDPEFRKASVHPILSTTGVHDPAEDVLNPPRHVECADCHNPHAANSSPAMAPTASGALAGLTGVNENGATVRPLTKQHELCFRCHADSLSRGQAVVPRKIVETNTRLEFAGNNSSFHPVLAPGRNPNVPSLITPWTTSSRMYCTDCHNSDGGPNAGGSGPNGPHGSAFSPILERQLVTTDFQNESAGSYALCYKCHNRSSILADQSFASHKLHIVDHQTACSTCHDSHGVQSQAGLINFNTLYVQQNSKGKLEFNSTGNYNGTCSLKCHDSEHDQTPYGPGATLQSEMRKLRTTPAPPRKRK